MFKYNEGIEQSDILQNKFTAYLVIVIRGRKINYIKAKKRIQKYEQSLEIPSNDENLLIKPDMLISLPVMEQIENEKLHTALKQAKAKDRYIFFEKVLENRSFSEIAAELGLKLNTVTSIYYRFIKNLKNELGDIKNEI